LAYQHQNIIIYIYLHLTDLLNMCYFLSIYWLIAIFYAFIEGKIFNIHNMWKIQRPKLQVKTSCCCIKLEWGQLIEKQVSIHFLCSKPCIKTVDWLISTKLHSSTLPPQKKQCLESHKKANLVALCSSPVILTGTFVLETAAEITSNRD